MKKAVLILSDSGGIQEEAPTFGTPVLVLREKTERPEGIKSGVCKLVGTRRAKIFEEADRVLRANKFKKRKIRKNPYGDGFASMRIVKAILKREQGLGQFFNQKVL